MKRAIVAPAFLADAALDELKGWLAITTTSDDATLKAMLKSALEMCEAFTGGMPLEASCEEVITASARWQTLATRPIVAVTGVQVLADDNSREALAPEAYAVEMDADGSARVRILRSGAQRRVVVGFTAGMAADWTLLPDGVRQGVIRLAAHEYRQRDTVETHAAPPASVAALWQPWRRMRLT